MVAKWKAFWSSSRSRPHRWGWFVLLWVTAMMSTVGCDCADQTSIGIVLKPKLSKPSSGDQLVARVEMEVTFDNNDPVDEIRVVEVFITPQGSSRRRKIGELYKKPYLFKWNSYQAKDGFYLIEAIAFSNRGDEFRTRKTLVQVVNSPPEMWFVNCVTGQFVRGDYTVVVSVNQTTLALKEPPLLTINGEPGPKTTDKRPPFRFPITTKNLKEGEVVEIVAIGTDTRGNKKRILCSPKIDNTPPTLEFTRPALSGLLLGRSFEAEFDARDRFGVREVRLWVDGSPCALDAKDPSKVCTEKNSWIGKSGPSYPIQVTLPKGYQTEQDILLTARAIDNAGNFSKPARLRIKIDPLEPEIFIRSPGQGEVIDDTVDFIARITDNQSLKRVEFRVEGGKKPIVLLSRSNVSLGSDIAPSFKEVSATLRFGLGKRKFVVIAEDDSGNIAKAERDFRIGCGDSTDCPLGQVCHKSVCTVPAGVNQPCGPDIPCSIETLCIKSSAPFCSPNKPSFCRKRCNPGNKYVQPQTCGSGFFCEKKNQVCIPADGCDPMTSQGCRSGEQCVLVDDDAGLCYPVGSVKDGAVCDQSCKPQGNCRKGSWCVFILSAGQTSCMRVCDTKNPTTCSSGFKCFPLRWSFGGGSLNIGVCGPAK